MASSEEVIAERNALAKDFQHLADLAGALNQKMQQAQEALAKLEVDAQQLHSLAMGSIGRFDQLIDTQGQNLTGLLNEMIGHAGSAQGVFDKAVADMQGQWTAAQGQLTALTQRAGELAQQGVTLESKAAENFVDLVSKIDGDRSEIGAAAQRRNSEVALADGHIQSLHKDWDGLINQIANALNQGDSEIAQHIEQSLHDELGSFADQLQQALQALADHDVAQTTSDLRQQMADELEHKLTELADKAIETLQHGLENSLKDLLGTRDHTVAEREVMEDLIKPIQPMIDEFINKVFNVKGIWDAVDHLI